MGPCGTSYWSHDQRHPLVNTLLEVFDFTNAGTLDENTRGLTLCPSESRRGCAMGRLPDGSSHSPMQMPS